MNKIIKNILNNKFFIILVMVNILYFLSNSYLIFSVFKLYNIENLIRLLLIIILFISFVFFTLKSIRFIAKRKRKRSIFLSIVIIIIFIIQCLLYNVIDKVYTSLNTISSNETLYSSSLVVLNESNINDVKELNNMKIGLYNNKESIEGYVIPKEIIKDRKLDKTNEIINYDGITDLVLGLYEKEVDAILITTNYSVLFSFNGFANIKDETKILISKEKKIKVEDNTRQEITEPFTILLMGVDSTLESIKSGSAFNGDALMLITFNPKTLNATMLSIPRDTYVPIVCFENQRENKITHAAWHGEECMIKTIENFTEIKIDYYAKINFKGLVKLVDNLGGIYVDVPYSLCEQNSNRTWGSDTVFLEKGYKKVNGEQALALSRNRHKPNDGSAIGKQMAAYCPTYNEGKRDDIERGQNQQKVINGIMSGVNNINKLDDIYNLLEIMGDSVETNINTNQILSLYNVIKGMLLNNSNSTISFDSLFLKGSDKLIWDEKFKTQLYNYYYNRQSLADIVKAMNINLEKVKPELIKEMNFSINETYEKTIIGKGPYKYESTINLVDTFISKDIEVAKEWGKTNNIKIEEEYVDVYNIEDNNKIIEQSIPYGYIVKNINEALIIKIGKYSDKVPEQIDDVIPNFETYSIDEAYTWKNNNTDKLIIIIEEIKIDSEEYNELNAGKLKSQSVEAGKLLKDYEEIRIIYYEKTKEEIPIQE